MATIPWALLWLRFDKNKKQLPLKWLAMAQKKKRLPFEWPAWVRFEFHATVEP